MKRLLVLLVVISSYSLVALARSPLAPVKTDSPRDTMKSFMEAMNDFRLGQTEGNPQLRRRINDALRTLNLVEIPVLVRDEQGRRAAVFLKEVIDRVLVIDYEKVPEDPNLIRWRLKDTEIVISRIKTGDREGEFLFSPVTVERAEEFFQRVKHLPYMSGSGQGAHYDEPWNKRHLPDWANKDLFGFKRWQWLALFSAILLGYLLKGIAHFIIVVLKRFAPKDLNSTRHQILTAIEKPIGLLVSSVFWYLTAQLLKFEGQALAILLTFIQLFISVSLVWMAYRLCDVVTEKFRIHASKTATEFDDQLVPLLSKALRVFVVVIGSLVAIQNLGFNVMSLLAGLGLGGLAFALAAKDTAANLFGSIMIFLDRPFKVGDWVVADKAEGTVVEVGFRSTRIKTFYDSTVTVPNSEMANANIDNMGARTYRRLKSVIGVTYDTDPELLEKFIEGIKKIIAEHPHTRKDYYHVVFNEYGPYSLNILLYCFFQVPDWSEELKEKQNIFMSIMRLAKELNVEFAFPTQSLHVESFPNPNQGLTPS